MGRYRVEIVGHETLTVTAADQIEANKTARRQTTAEPPLTTYISEVTGDE